MPHSRTHNKILDRMRPAMRILCVRACGMRACVRVHAWYSVKMESRVDGSSAVEGCLVDDAESVFGTHRRMQDNLARALHLIGGLDDEELSFIATSENPRATKSVFDLVQTRQGAGAGGKECFRLQVSENAREKRF